MGLLDGLLVSVMGGMMGGGQAAPGPQGVGSSQMIQMALRVLQQNGGIEGLLAKFQQAGMGQQAQSWIGTGQNMPISPDVLAQIFGQGQLGQIAQQMGMSHEQAAGDLAQALPRVVDHMTPGGEIPAEQNDLVAQALEILQRGRQA